MSRLQEIKHPLLMAFCLSMAGGVVEIVCWLLKYARRGETEVMSTLRLILIAAPISGMFLVFPLVMTVLEICLLVSVSAKGRMPAWGYATDIITIVFLIFRSSVYCYIMSYEAREVFDDVKKQAPFYTQSVPVICAMALVGIAGYCLIHFVRFEKRAERLYALGIVAMSLGTLESIACAVQVVGKIGTRTEWYLILLPLDCLMILARTVLHKIRERKEIVHH